MNKVHLVVIDPQNDFADSKGTLFVPGADKDMKDRLPKMIKRLGDKIADLHVTLDSHHLFHIGNPLYWKNTKGEHPNPFTGITSADVEKGVWTPSVPSLYKYSLEYVKELERKARYTLTVWPPHCLIGTKGHAVVDELQDAFQEWEKNVIGMIDYITKGSNYKTEHYSGLMAEVQDPSDPSTQLNVSFINTLANDCDIVAVCGECSSHCLKSTVEDIWNNFSDPAATKKIVLLTDAMSPVPGFEKQADAFLAEAKTRGVQFSTTTDFLK
jgi:nicotinamidase/pyrazinamidase